MPEDTLETFHPRFEAETVPDKKQECQSLHIDNMFAGSKRHYSGTHVIFLWPNRSYNNKSHTYILSHTALVYFSGVAGRKRGERCSHPRAAQKTSYITKISIFNKFLIIE